MKLNEISLTKVFFTEQKYPFADEPNSSRLGSIIETSARRKIHKSFIHDDSVREFVGFKPAVIDKEHKKTDNTNDILPIENSFHGIGIAQERILLGKITGVILNFKRLLIRCRKTSKDAEVVFNGIRGVVENFFEKCFYRKYGNGDLVSFNRLSFFSDYQKKDLKIEQLATNKWRRQWINHDTLLNIKVNHKQ